MGLRLGGFGCSKAVIGWRIERIASWKLTPRGVCFQLAFQHMGQSKKVARWSPPSSARTRWRPPCYYGYFIAAGKLSKHLFVEHGGQAPSQCLAKETAKTRYPAHQVALASPRRGSSFQRPRSDYVGYASSLPAHRRRVVPKSLMTFSSVQAIARMGSFDQQALTHSCRVCRATFIERYCCYTRLLNVCRSENA